MFLYVRSCAAVQPTSAFRSPKHDRPLIDIDYSSDCKYWIISIKCRDRTKLLFDTGESDGWMGKWDAG